MKKVNKRKVTIFALAAALAATVAIGGSLAFLTDSDKKTNHINVTTDLDVTVEEPDWDPEDEPEKIFPGDTYYKDPRIQSKNNVYARLKVTYVDQATNETITDADRIALIEKVIKNDPDHNFEEGESYSEADITETAMTNTTDFEKVAGDAGVNYYYFKTTDGYVLELPEGEDTVLTNPLFTSVIVPTDWDNDAITALGKFNLDIEVEAIQADNNELPDTVVDINSYDTWFNANYTTPAP